MEGVERWGWAENKRPGKLNDGAGRGTRKDRVGMRIGGGTERAVRRFRLTAGSLSHRIARMDEKQIDDTQLKLYLGLVDQLQKHMTILWQFPMALLAANAFALDRFLQQPFMVLALAIVDGVFTYALHRVVIQQHAIINATKAREEIFRQTGYSGFFPEFSTVKVGGPLLIIYMLWCLTASLAVFALIKILC
jgi:hypothetical protein